MLRTLFAVAATLSLSTAGEAQAAPTNAMMRCTDADVGYAYTDLFFAAYHNPATQTLCGGDPLTRGSVTLNASHAIVLNLEGAHPFNLYEVYFVPFGGDPVTDRVHLGGVTTDCNGDVNRTVRLLNRPIDSVAGVAPSFSRRVGPSAAGAFFVYSRGPMGSIDNGACQPSVFNTTNGLATGSFANPTLWGGGSGYDGLQFISGVVAP
jgi:hypothetical protein